MSVSDPDDLHRLFAERANARDLDGMVELYEQTATFVAPGGDAVSGAEAIREHLRGMLAVEPQITPLASKALVAGDVALLSNHWRMTLGPPGSAQPAIEGTSIEVARRQPGGGWLYVIDDPSSATAAVG